MKLLRIFSFVCAFIFCLAGCHNTTIEGDDFSDSVGYYVGYNSLKNRKLLGYFYVKSDMKWNSVYADVVDDSLNVLRSVNIYKNTSGESFNINAQDFESPYLKLSFGCSLANGDSTTYTIYLNLYNTDYPHFTLLNALKKYRIETMLRDEKLPLSLAIRLSNRELLEFFSVYYSKSLDELGDHLRNIREYPYLFSDYYLNPLQFAKNFDDLAREFDNVMSGKKKSFEYDSVMVTDNTLYAYGEKYFSELPFKTIYGFPKCESKNEGAVLFNEIERSYYKSKPFKCVSGAWQLTNVSSSSSAMSSSSSDNSKWCLNESRTIEIGKNNYGVAYDSLCSSMFVNKIDSLKGKGTGFEPSRHLDSLSTAFMNDLVDSTTLKALKYWYEHHPFVNWKDARLSCPEGFHIPDTLEFKNSDWNFDNNQLGVFEGNPAYDESNPKDVFAFAFLWTSDSLSEEKRFCARLSFHESPVSLSSKILPIKPYFVDIIECPADMDMAVQLACVKKMEKK